MRRRQLWYEFRAVQLACPGEGNGNPLQYSCLENGQRCLVGYSPWVVVGNDYTIGHTKSWTWLSNLTDTSTHWLKSEPGKDFDLGKSKLLITYDCCYRCSDILMGLREHEFLRLFLVMLQSYCAKKVGERVVCSQKLQGNCTRGREKDAKKKRRCTSI